MQEILRLLMLPLDGVSLPREKQITSFGKRRKNFWTN